MPDSIKIICMWCWKYLRGDYDATLISHGLCRSCFAREMEQEETNPWAMWQDIGGEEG